MLMYDLSLLMLMYDPLTLMIDLPEGLLEPTTTVPLSIEEERKESHEESRREEEEEDRRRRAGDLNSLKRLGLNGLNVRAK